MSSAFSAGTRGVGAAVTSSVIFAGIFFLTPLMHPSSSEALWGIRAICTIPLLLLVLFAGRQQVLIADIWRRIRANPLFVLTLIASSALLSLQLWLFGWAPLHDRGLQVALGYFLLPLALIVVGRVFFQDRLTWWQWVAAGIAAAGVVFELFRVGGVSWETLVVCLGYPVYFVLRRQLKTGHLGGMFWDLAIASPVAIFFVVREIATTPTLTENPMLWWFGPLYGLVTGCALALYLTASKLLSLSLFGLLSYLEPALLMVAALLNGEQIAAGELFMYGAIWLAVLVILAGGITQMLRTRKR